MDVTRQLARPLPVWKYTRSSSYVHTWVSSMYLSTYMVDQKHPPGRHYQKTLRLSAFLLPPSSPSTVLLLLRPPTCLPRQSVRASQSQPTQPHTSRAFIQAAGRHDTQIPTNRIKGNKGKKEEENNGRRRQRAATTTITTTIRSLDDDH